MGLRPTKEMKNAFCPATALSMEAPPSPLSSRAKPRDLQFRGPFLEMFFDRAYPDFLLRGTRDGHVCGPGQPGPHEVRQRHETRQETRGSAAEGSAVSFLHPTKATGSW
jgi:hypothetical protein